MLRITAAISDDPHYGPVVEQLPGKDNWSVTILSSGGDEIVFCGTREVLSTVFLEASKAVSRND